MSTILNITKTQRPQCLYPDCDNKTNYACLKCHAPLCGVHFNKWHFEYQCSLYVPREYL